MSTYATLADLTARLSPAYTAPSVDDFNRLVVKASELIDYATMGRAEAAWVEDDASASSLAVTRATCDQIEFWLEVGEESDVTGLKGSLQGGRVQISKLPNALGQRAMRTLLTAGLYWSGAGSF